MKRLFLLAGARPNYMKVFPIWKELHRRQSALHPVLVHTGQHYDNLMSDIFFQDFGMPQPDYFLGVGSGPHGAQTGRTMIALEELFQKHRPHMLVVVGDVNSTAAGALVAVKMGVPVAHVEAGLRSGDRTMPEEINRIVTDSISDLLLTSCRDADQNLLREGIPANRIRFVGNVMIDSLAQVLPRAQGSKILSQLKLAKGGYVAVTLHRPSNVDQPARLKLLMEQLAVLAEKRPVVFPIHPRTSKMLDSSNLKSQISNLLLVPPLGYLDFLCLQAESALVITDSGGVQEETSYLGLPCLTVRPNTERPVTITEGTNRLIDPARESLAAAAAGLLRAYDGQRRPCTIEHWDGRAAERIVEALEELA